MQLGLFDTKKETAAEKESKKIYYSQLDIHSRINLRYNHSFCITFYRNFKIESKGIFDKAIRKEQLKATQAPGIHMNWIPSNWSVSTTMWLDFGFIHGSSSLASQYFKLNLTFDMIVAKRIQKERSKEKRINNKQTLINY